jgi:hypothetical protein
VTSDFGELADRGQPGSRRPENDKILGPDRYCLAHNRQEIDRGVGEARGAEFYPT